jgi:CspA family cold shock protein
MMWLESGVRAVQHRAGSTTTLRGRQMPTGTVKWFNSAKGYGFIEPNDGSADAFVHISAVEQAGLSGLREGQKVEYEVVPGRNGKSSAENLVVSD